MGNSEQAQKHMERGSHLLTPNNRTMREVEETTTNTRIMFLAQISSHEVFRWTFAFSNMMRIQRCCLILLCTVQYVLGSTMFSISDSGVQCNGGNFQVDSLSVDCGETYCTFGSAVEISGTGKSLLEENSSIYTAEINLTLRNLQ